MRQSQDIFVCLDRDGFIRHMNLDAKTYLDCTEGSLFCELFSKDIQGKIQDEITTVLKTGKISHLILAKWDKTTALFSLYPLSDEEGKLIGVASRFDPMSFVDNNQLLFQQMISLVPVEIFILDSCTNIVALNKGAENLFGYESQDLIEKNIDIIVPHRVFEIYKELKKRYLLNPIAKHITEDMNFFVQRKNKKPVSVEVRVNPFFSQKNQYIIVVFRNLNNTLRENRTLKKRLRDLEEFVFITSRLLLNPIHLISSKVESIEEALSGNFTPEITHYFDYIKKALTRSTSLVNGMLAFFKHESKREVSDVKCLEIVEDVLGDLEKLIRENKTSIIVGPLPIIKGCRLELIDLFQNLISNAIKFSGKVQRPEVNIQCREEEKSWIFSISDNGIGISDKDQQKIFTLFERLHTQQEYPGTGIGLATCKKIIERHKGRLWVESKEKEGAVFYFEIPKVII